MVDAGPLLPDALGENTSTASILLVAVSVTTYRLFRTSTARPATASEATDVRDLVGATLPVAPGANSMITEEVLGLLYEAT